ncbi:hypothetical protein BpHYR1_052656 [Brachionus plicatilis]|uniref:Uncharacterized protein n=1 Tax=Brachionus plicatilis TaxID=10195 RepID=A0A3M7QES5_BRAPC|nr:hypothetical protein BpHYR1_052656 [Brachionus plicatilis]
MLNNLIISFSKKIELELTSQPRIAKSNTIEEINKYSQEKKKNLKISIEFKKKIALVLLIIILLLPLDNTKKNEIVNYWKNDSKLKIREINPYHLTIH